MTTLYTPLSRLSATESFIALLVAAIETNDHASAEEAARAEHVVHEVPRLRRLSGATRGRIIEEMKAAVRERGTTAVMAAASEHLPPALHRQALIAIAEVMLSHGLDRIEGTALLDVADRFGFSPEDTAAALDEARRNLRARD
jgi:hypothetical protein